MTLVLSAPRLAQPLRLAGLVGVVALLFVVSLLHLGFGARPIAPRVVLEAFLAFDPASFDHRVVRDLRLPRLCAGLMVGAALGVCGALLQAVTRNPLGEPHVLGLNAGATFAVVTTLTLGPWLGRAGVPVPAPATLLAARPLVAALGAGAMFAAVMTIGAAGRLGATPLKMTLCGVALSGFAAALTSAQLILDDQTLATLRLWLAGDLSGVSLTAVWGVLPWFAAGLGLAFALSGRLNVLGLGDDVARGLGVNLTRTRGAALVAAGVLCGAAVSLAGPVGFVGLLVPHVARTLFSRDHRLLLPLCAMLGASLLLAADLAARALAAPREFATGVVTALIGVPVFLLLAARSR